MSTLVDANLERINPLMTTFKNLVYNTICKMSYYAEKLETDEMRLRFRAYRNAYEKLDTLKDYEIDLSELQALRPSITREIWYGLNFGDLRYEDYFKENEIEHLLTIVRNILMYDYVEENDYYRMLMGLPPMKMDEEDWAMIENDAGVMVPIHTLNEVEVARIRRSGRLQVILGEYSDQWDYMYIEFIDKRIPPIISRVASQYDVLYQPQGEAYSRYRDVYNKQKIVYLDTFSNDYYNLSTDYNEATELLIIKMRALLFYHMESNSPMIDRNDWTPEDALDKWDENGLSLPQNMPVEYRNSVTFMLNYLISIKGTNYVIEYCSEKIFSGLRMYKYFIRKRMKPEFIGVEIPEGTPATDVYIVDFVLRPFNATNIVDFAEPGREDKVLTYDEIREIDPRWSNSEEMKRQIFEEPFSYVESKYLSLDNYVDLMKFSDDIAIVTRVFIERKRTLANINMRYPSTGSYHTFFNLFVYFLALYTSIISKIEVQSADTLKKLELLRVYGFKVPDNLALMRAEFILYFRQHDLMDFLDKFPNAMTDSLSFLELLVEMDKAIGVAPMFNDIILSCVDFDQVEHITQLFQTVRLVRITPSSYNMAGPTINGKTYTEYLEEQDPLLALLYHRVMNDDTWNSLTLELDNAVLFITNALSNLKITGNEEIQRVIDVFSDVNIFISGISKYLLYILKIFKSYCTDFITDSNIFEIDGRFNWQYNIDELKIDIDWNMYLRWNVSQYHRVDLGDTRKLFHFDHQENYDGVFMVTPYGTVDISYY